MEILEKDLLLIENESIKANLELEKKRNAKKGLTVGIIITNLGMYLRGNNKKSKGFHLIKKNAITEIAYTRAKKKIFLIYSIFLFLAAISSLGFYLFSQIYNDIFLFSSLFLGSLSLIFYIIYNLKLEKVLSIISSKDEYTFSMNKYKLKDINNFIKVIKEWLFK